MRILHPVHIIWPVLFILILSSCCKEEEMNTPENPFDEISDIAVSHGNMESNIVVVTSQGGPSLELIDEDLILFIAETQTQSALWVNVHQAQTKNPSLFTSSDITFEQAKQHDLESVANLNRVIDFYKNQQGKTVYVLGLSFGAFVTQELIATYGIDVADGYLIITGRLDIEEDAWSPLSEGEFTEYVYDSIGNYNIITAEEVSIALERNMARLAAGLGFNRYTERLSPISDLSKITYVHGDRDDQVGPLSSQEIEFLNNKGANVVLSAGGNHGSAGNTGFNILKQTFGIQ